MSTLEHVVDAITQAAVSDPRSDLALGVAAGVSAGTIKQIRAGGFRPATIRKLSALEKVLDVSTQAAAEGQSLVCPRQEGV